MTDQKGWLITGAGRGMGVDMAKAALDAGPTGVAVAAGFGRCWDAPRAASGPVASPATSPSRNPTTPTTPPSTTPTRPSAPATPAATSNPLVSPDAAAATLRLVPC
jgi:hypothetical protein